MTDYPIDAEGAYNKQSYYMCIYTVRCPYVTHLTVRGLTRGRMLIPSFALLDYRVTNQIYIYEPRKSSSANSEIKQCQLGNQAVPNEAL